MRLSYNVLCIDNDIASLNRIKGEFSEFNANVGIEVFYTDIEVKPGAREVLEKFRARIMQDLNNVFSNNDIAFDMILVDLHMEGGINGQDMISAIRESHSLYRPIIFYSAGNPPDDDNAINQLNQEASQANILGKNIFITPRGQLGTLLPDIAREMHREEHKINQVRGLLMDQVSELDAHIIKIISTAELWEAVDESKRAAVTQEFRERMATRVNKINDIHMKTKDLEYPAIKAYVLENPRDVDTFTKGKILRRILAGIKKFQSHGSVLSDGLKDTNSLISTRNDYGHKTAKVLLSEIHNDAKCKFVREESRRQVKNIKEILEN